MCEANAHRIFNMDESGFPLQGTNSKLKVVAETGSKNIHRLASDSKEQITVLACVSAAGEFQKPLIIFPGKRAPKWNFGTANPEDYDVGYTASGWITAESFFSYFSSLFHARNEDIEHPIIVFSDEHTSHVNVAISEYCMGNDIILYLLRPHASHIRQPLDVSVFSSLKKNGTNKRMVSACSTKRP